MILFTLSCGLVLEGMMMINSFDEWLAFGVERGWVSEPVCDTHEGPPLSEAESAEFDDGGDPCVHVLRLFEVSE
jgi:hypothetical protein